MMFIQGSLLVPIVCGGLFIVLALLLIRFFTRGEAWEEEEHKGAGKDGRNIGFRGWKVIYTKKEAVIMILVVMVILEEMSGCNLIGV